MIIFTKSQKIFIALIFVILIAGITWFLVNGKPKTCTPDPLKCWDGSLVYRKGPKCGFTSCPARKKNSTIQTFETEKDLKTPCKSNKDCNLPGEYAAMSSCRYEVACISGSCNVICPSTLKVDKNMINQFKEYQESQLKTESENTNN